MHLVPSLLLLLTVGCAYHRPPVVLDVRVEGTDREGRALALGSDISARARRQRIRDRELARRAVRDATSHGNTKPWQLVPGLTLLRPKVRLDEVAFAADGRSVKAYFEDQGFFDVSVHSSIEPHPLGRLFPREEPRQLSLVHRVDPGERAWVSAYRLEGLEPPLSEEIGLDLPPGWYDGRRIIEAAEAVRIELAHRGYARAEVTWYRDLRPDGTWHVTLSASPGETTVYGELFWDAQGNKAVAKLGRTVRADLPLGAPYDELDVQRVAMRLERDAVFSDVHLTPERSGEGAVPIVIEADEGTGWTVRPAVVATGQGGMYDLAVGVRFEGRRIGLLRRLSTLRGEALVGWALAPSAFGGSGDTGPLTAHNLELQVPLVPLRPLFFLVGGGLGLDLQQAYHSAGFDLRLGFGWTPMPALTLSLFQVWEGRSFFPLGADQSGRFQEAFDEHDFSVAYALTYTTIKASLDLRDDPHQPREGGWFDLAVVPTSNQLVRLDAEARGYLPIGELVTLAGRTRIGLVETDPADGELLGMRYHLGGTQDVRGWAWRALQPPGFDAADNALQTGGKVLWFGSAELRMHTFRDLTWTVFTDVGRVWEETTDVDLADLQPSAGVGLRSPSPFGPLRIEWAARLRRDTEIAHFDDSWWQLHLAFGDAF